MKEITLGKTGIKTPQNAFGALPIQRVTMDEAVKILQRAYEGGMTFFDTARAYSDSEEKLGQAFEGMRDKIFIASKTMAKTPDEFWKQLDISLTNLKTDYLDIYQLHCVPQCYKPDDGTGMYECMLKAKEQGIIKHIGITAHNIETAFQCVQSGLYETMQFPFSYLCSEREIELVNLCKEKNVGFIAMKGLAGGLIHNSKAAMAYISKYDNVLPIWGIQKMSELEEWLKFMDEEPVLNDEISEYIEKERKELVGDRISTEATGEVIDAKGLYVIPGLTDIHFHACVGYDFCDGTQEAISKMARYELENGITTICPASMTFSEEKLGQIFETAKEYDGKDGAELVGINMEGPFISMEKKGAQNPEFIHKPDAEMFYRLQEKAGGLIKLVDIAPEVDGAIDCIKKIKDDVRVSVAHTAATYDQAKEAFDNGAKHVTHLYNGMNAFHHRNPGVIGAACDNENVTVELIVDGVHSHPSTVRTTFKMFGDDRIIMISDSMMACGLDDGQYTLGGLDVTVKGNVATLTGEGNIAGSVTNLMNCVRTAVKKMEIPLESAIKCAAVNPAKAIGIYDRFGSIAPGKVANIVLLDKDLNIKSIIKDGNII